MPKPHPPHRTDCPYHITARTNNQEWFGLDLSEVWKIYAEQLYFISNAFGIRIHGFVLMSNHFHLLISDPQGMLSPAIRWLMTETARLINKRLGKKNHVYGQRHYRSLIQSYHYYTHAYKYIYRNPVEAGICKNVEEYQYSTLRGLLGFANLEFPIEDSLLMDDLEGTLKWLNLSVTKENKRTIQLALKKGIFELRKETSTRNLSRLEVEKF
jgi:putative transposase